MSRTYRLTPHAEKSLTEIVRWTIAALGSHAADRLEAEFSAWCEAIVTGQADSLNCPVLGAAADLRYLGVAGHFLVFLDRPDAVMIIDILPARTDLPRRIAAMSTLKGQGG